MCEFYIEDPLFKELFNSFFKEGVTDESMLIIDSVIINTFNSEIVIDILNIVKASIISKDNFSITYKRIRSYIDSKTKISEKVIDYFIVALSLKYLITQKSDGIETLMRTKRDFITEVIMSKFKVKEMDITKEMKDAVLKTPGDVYSIDDPPITDWDKYFFNICRQVARNSKCLSRRIGAVLVEDKSIISTGYNGPPRGIPKCDSRWIIDAKFIEKYKPLLPEGAVTQGGCPRYALGAKSGEMLDICTAAHAEENAILDAARRGVKTKGSTLFMTCFTGDTEVTTLSGLKAIKDITIGDKVLSKNGKFNQVYKIHRRNYSGDILTIKPKGLELFDFKVTPTHKIFGKKAGTCFRKGNESRSCFLCYDKDCENNISDINPEELFAKDLTEEDYLFVPDLLETVNFTIDTRRGQSKKRTTLKEIPDEFFEDAEYPWIVGLFLAEGSVNKVSDGTYLATTVFTLHKKETYYSDRIVAFFKKYGFNVTVKDENNTKRVWINSNQIAEHLVAVCGEGAENKSITNGLLFSDKVLEVIDGLYCGDGTKIKDQKSITTISMNLAKQVSLVLLLNGFNVRVHEEEEKVDKNNINHQKAYRIFYSDNDKNQINRKNNFVKISSINKTNYSEIDVFDLSIENDASYSVGPFAVHNCGIPCFRCLIKIIQAGISEIVVTGIKFYDDNSEFLINNSKLKVRLYNF